MSISRRRFCQSLASSGLLAQPASRAAVAAPLLQQPPTAEQRPGRTLAASIVSFNNRPTARTWSCPSCGPSSAISRRGRPKRAPPCWNGFFMRPFRWRRRPT